jgi:hypothetical protein
MCIWKWKNPYPNKIMLAYLDNFNPIWVFIKEKLTKWSNLIFSMIELETIVCYIIIHLTHYKIYEFIYFYYSYPF